MVGDWLTYVAVGVWAIGDGPGAVLLVLLAHTVPRALAAPWAGRLADRVDRRRLLVLGSAARGVAVLGMAIAAACGAPMGVMALLVVRMALGALVDSAAVAAVPRLVPTSMLARAHAVLGTTWSVVFAAGVGLGGVLTAIVGPAAVLAIDAATFCLAAVIFAGLPALRPRPAGVCDAARADGWRPAIAMLRARPALRRAALTKFPVMVANGGAWILVHALAGRGTGATVALTLGGLHLLRAVGTGVGPWLWLKVSGLRGTEWGLRVSTAVVVAGTGLLALAPGTIGQVTGVLLWGVGMGAHWTTAATRVQTLAPDRFVGRLAAVDLLSHTAGQGIGGGVGSLGLALAATVGGPGLAVGLAVPAALIGWAAIEWSPKARASAARASPQGLRC